MGLEEDSKEELRTTFQHDLKHILIHNPLYNVRTRYEAVVDSLQFFPNEILRLILLMARLIYPQTKEEMDYVLHWSECPLLNKPHRENTPSESLRRHYYYASSDLFICKPNSDDVNFRVPLDTCLSNPSLFYRNLFYVHHFKPPPGDIKYNQYRARYYPKLYPENDIPNESNMKSLALLSKTYPEQVKSRYRSLLGSILDKMGVDITMEKLRILNPEHICDAYEEVVGSVVIDKEPNRTLIERFNTAPRHIDYILLLNRKLLHCVDHKCPSVRHYTLNHPTTLDAYTIRKYYKAHEYKTLSTLVVMNEDPKEWAKVKDALGIP